VAPELAIVLVAVELEPAIAPAPEGALRIALVVAGAARPIVPAAEPIAPVLGAPGNAPVEAIALVAAAAGNASVATMFLGAAVPAGAVPLAVVAVG